MLLVRCEYCQGTGKQACPQGCACGNILPGCGDKPQQRNAEDLEVGQQVDSDARRRQALDGACPLCQGSGQVACPGCCGTGYVDMPAWA